MNDTTFVLVNGVAAELGCYIDSHRGQYGPDMLPDVCASFGINLNDFGTLPSEYRHQAENGNVDAWEQYYDATQALENLLNDATPIEGYGWFWNDGDFGLYAYEDDGWD